MGKFRVEIEELAKNHIEKHLKSGDKISVGNPEPLKYQLTGKWSRQINRKDRIIYKVGQEVVTVFVISAMGHYNDK